MDGATKATWIELDKRKQLLGKFASQNLQKNYEDVILQPESTTITFTTMVQRLTAHYKPTRNRTLANFEFHKLKQKHDESYDIFENRVKHEATRCELSCVDAACSIRDVMIRDQIIIGTSNVEICNYALKNQWLLADLIMQGRQIEAATIASHI